MHDRVRRLDLPRDDPLVRLTTARSEIAAEMLAERLRQHGIDSLIRIDDDMRATTRALGLLAWAYPVFVLESDYERARAFLEEFGQTEPETSGSPLRRQMLVGSLGTIALTLILILALLARSL